MSSVVDLKQTFAVTTADSQEGAVPYNPEAEQLLLGTLLYNNAPFEKTSEFLKPDHFVNPIHQQIYTAIQRYVERGHVADPITLKGYFSQHADVEQISAYLVGLATNAHQIIDVEHYGRIIYDLYLRRQLIALGSEVVIEARRMDTDKTTDEQITDVEQKLFYLATQQDSQRAALPFKAALTEAINSAKKAFQSDRKIVGVTSGLKSVDDYMGGFHNSDLVILAGRPSMGKTALATTIAFNAAKAHLEKRVEGAGVLFFSLEMSAEQLATRLLASESQVSSEKIRRGELTSASFERFIEVSRELENMNLFIDDTPALSVSSLRSRARRLKRQHDIGFIIVDYLQLLTTGRHGGDNRVNEISEISRSLKAIAKELSVPIIALSQLSRAVEQRDDKRPQLSDLRESGSIEQDADVVLFVYREEYYLARKEPNIEDIKKYNEWTDRLQKVANTAEVIIGKQRHGPVGTVRLHFDGRFTRFSNLDQVYQEDVY
jgi:replicative DNA helicase